MAINRQDLAMKLRNYKESSFKYQQRRHEDWRENYQLYRDKVVTNRLTQRQSVNVPLTKETVKTILSRIDDFYDAVFDSLSNDRQKEVFLNEYWAYTVDDDHLVVKDIIDKKQVCLYGISWQKLMVIGGRFMSEVLDPHDIIVDRYADPADIDGTANYVQHLHIYKTLADIEANEWYDKSVVASLKAKYATANGLIKSAENAQANADRNQRMEDMGVVDMANPAIGQTIIEINESFIRLWDERIKENVWHLAVEADGEVLMFYPLEDIIGETEDHYWRYHLPLTTWSDDVERTDLYPDGVADIVRTPNKILNVWLSQLVENRTLRNFGMRYYDSTAAENFVPQTYEPVPFGWYPTPGDPNRIIKDVSIPDLSESMDEMAFVVGMAERATAATATEKGEASKGAITLGEIKLISEKALKRITAMSKFHKLSRKEFAYKWYKMVEANGEYLTPVKLYKKSYRGNYFSKEITAKDWKDAVGYRCKVTSSAEQDEENLQTIQKLGAVKAQFPENMPLERIYQKKLLDLAKLSPDEQKEVLDFEAQKREQLMNPPVAPTTPNPLEEALKAQTQRLGGGVPVAPPLIPTPVA